MGSLSWISGWANLITQVFIRKRRGRKRNQGSWQESSVTRPAHLSCQEPEKMKVSMVLSLIGYLVVPSGGAVMGRCVVAKKLKDGGLDYFEGYSLANSLLNPDLKKTIECVKKIVKEKDGMGAWPSWSLNCQYSDTLMRWLDGCRL
ncbi:lysozyme-like protein 4 isoform X4 [Crocuta crocuta]